MPLTVPTGFHEAKNAKAKTPIWLYRLSLDGNPANDVFWAEWNDDVSYFKDTSTAQVYTAKAMSHSGLGSNIMGSIDAMRVSLSNVDRTVQALLEAYDGLAGNQVTVRRVFEETLADATAYLEDVFWVDHAEYDEQAVTLHLRSRLDLMEVTAPRRTFARYTCGHDYKGEGCWLWDGAAWVAPDGFDTDAGGGGDVCGRTQVECERHNNTTRFGGFPSVPSSQVVFEG